VKEIINKLNLVKIKNFCSAKENFRRIIRQITDWEKILQKTHLIKDYYLKYTKMEK
jgi:hypothetical protein